MGVIAVSPLFPQEKFRTKSREDFATSDHLEEEKLSSKTRLDIASSPIMGTTRDDDTEDNLAKALSMSPPPVVAATPAVGFMFLLLLASKQEQKWAHAFIMSLACPLLSCFLS